MLQLTATGNVGKDATITQTGTDYAINFSVATNRKYTNGKGVQVEETKWVECTIWRKQGDNLDIAQYLKAGTKVLVQGEPDLRWYVNANGEVVTVQTLRVRSQELLSSKKEEPTPAVANNAEPEATATGNKKKPAPAGK
jgi:single-strand DNA-binding protein